ncbi:MAG TPA: hypothetical protein DDW50_11335 [Firmicutes bacterium]|nr:hypothetical protein [Bacillota bacterium]
MDYDALTVSQKGNGKELPNEEFMCYSNYYPIIPKWYFYFQTCANPFPEEPGSIEMFRNIIGDNRMPAAGKSIFKAVISPGEKGHCFWINTQHAINRTCFFYFFMPSFPSCPSQHAFSRSFKIERGERGL